MSAEGVLREAGYFPLSVLSESESWDYSTLSPAQKRSYIRMRAGGQSHSIALLLASRRFPATRTDADFVKGSCNGNQFEGTPQLGDFYRSTAERHGGDTTGKVYLSQLAEFPGDPQAWVSSRGDVERVCRDRGWGCSGLVDVELPEENRPRPSEVNLKGVRVADDLIAAEAASLCEEDPGLKLEDAADRVASLRNPGDNADAPVRVPPVPDWVNEEFGGLD